MLIDWWVFGFILMSIIALWGWIVAFHKSGEVKVHSLRADVINRASKRYAKEIEEALHESGASAHHDFGASTAAHRIYILAADRDLALAQLANVTDKLAYAALRLQQKERQVANLNQEANRELEALAETPGFQLADTLGLPSLSRDPRVTSQHSWMLLEEYQRRAKLPVPDGVYQTTDKRVLNDDKLSGSR